MPKAKTTLLIDGDITAFSFSARNEKPICWGNDWWTLHSDFATVKGEIEAHYADLVEELGADKIIVCLSDRDRDNNFRRDLYPAYKSNRKPSRKPVCFWPTVEWMAEEYTTFERPRLEGDDVLGILATAKVIKGNKIIVSIDKDMKTIPGNIYRTSHPDEGVVKVTQAEADYAHLFQALTGDATDGYPGCPGVGPVKATKILADAVLNNESGPTDFWGAIVQAYDKAGFGEEEALVQARVARILRAEDYDFKKKEPILWTPSA